jgi:predicted exporter
MPSLTIFSRLYRFFVPRRRLLFTGVALLIAASILLFQGIRLEENIAAMLPDGRSEVAADFALLQQAPFARKVIVSLEAEPGTARGDLLAAADRLCQALTPPEFTRAVSGPADLADGRLFTWLPTALPGLLNRPELVRWGAELDSAGIERRLQDVHDRLLSPEGWVLKAALRQDPLGLNRLGLAKLRQLNLVPGALLEGNHFLSADGRHVLVVADTPVAITDSQGVERVQARLRQALAESVPAGVRANVVSGHAYTAANAGAIKRDLVVVLAASTLALLALFLVFLRHWRAVFVFLVPVSVVCLAAVAVSLVYPAVSAITLGFGAVLLGISVDFALHVYFALRSGGDDSAAVMSAVARPVLFGGLTTVAAFGVLLLSDLPGQRQLAVFAIVGLTASLLLSLLVLPHLIPPSPAASVDWPPRFSPKRRLSRSLLLGIWGGLLLVAGWQATHLRFDGDLRSLSLVPPELRAAEKELQEVWGNMRGRALVFVEGSELEGALAANDRLFAFLAERLAAEEVISLAPLLPSAANQEANRQSWQGFWRGSEGQRIQADLLARSKVHGFTADAFAPFIDSLAQPSASVGPEELRRAGLGELVEAMVLPTAAGYRILSLVPDTPEIVDLFEAAREELPGVRLVSQQRFGQELSRAIRRDFVRFVSLASLLVILLLAGLFRDLKKVLLALTPVATGLTVLFGVMGAIGLKFTLLNVMATILVIGLGVDYGIFMVCKMTEGYDHATGRAVLVSGLTTVAGFGALVLASHPALHSIGVTVLLGIGAAIPTALLVIPAFYRGRA